MQRIIRPNDPYCDGCFYQEKIGSMKACCYILYELQKRPCPPGEGCTVKRTQKKEYNGQKWITIDEKLELIQMEEERSKVETLHENAISIAKAKTQKPVPVQIQSKIVEPKPDQVPKPILDPIPIQPQKQEEKLEPKLEEKPVEKAVVEEVQQKKPKKKPVRYPKHEWSQEVARRMVDLGYNKREIATVVGTTYDTIKHWMTRNGLKSKWVQPRKGDAVRGKSKRRN